jgi:hypothetical protein
MNEKKQKNIILVSVIVLTISALFGIIFVTALTHTSGDVGFSVGKCIYPTTGGSGQWMGGGKCSDNKEYYCQDNEPNNILRITSNFSTDEPYPNPLDEELTKGNSLLIYGGCSITAPAAPCCPANFSCVDEDGIAINTIGEIGDGCALRICAKYETEEECEENQCVYISPDCIDPSEFTSCSDYSFTSEEICESDPADVKPEECSSSPITSEGRIFSLTDCRCEWVTGEICRGAYDITDITNFPPTEIDNGVCYITYEDEGCNQITGVQKISQMGEIIGGEPIDDTIREEVCPSLITNQFYCGGAIATLKFVTTASIILAILLIIIFYLAYLKKQKRKQTENKTKKKRKK